MHSADVPPAALPGGTSSPPPPPREIGADLIACDGCGRSFMTIDGPGMIAALQGPCPDCGGQFRLLS